MSTTNSKLFFTKQSILIPVIIFSIFCLFNCTQNKDEDLRKEDDINKVYSDKKKEAENLKKEVEILRNRKDSLAKIYEKSLAEVSLSKLIQRSKLDHVTLAVKNINSAKNNYSNQLGFTIKEGRVHKNGLINSFIKFSDGSALELVTTNEPKDDLADWYKNFINNSEGVAFTALENDQLDLLYDKLTESGFVINKQSNNSSYSIVNFQPQDFMHHFFFINYTHKIYDSLETFKHKNGATKLFAVWISIDNIDKAKKQYSLFGFNNFSYLSIPSQNLNGMKIELTKSKIYLLFSSFKNKIMGVTLLTNDILKSQSYFQKSLQINFEIFKDSRGKSIFIPPDYTSNIWIEFLEMN
jgi:hypothetical protein